MCIRDRGGNATFVEHLDFLGFLVPRVDENEPDARVEEGELAEAMLQSLEIELGAFERLRARHEGNAGAALVSLAHDLERRFGLAMAEAHEMLLAVAPYCEVEPFAERVDDADADAVEAARHLVGIVV